jgi:hypothetical protein
MKAIPTMYKGVQMKSRLEADVAFLLDQMGCEWEYEPQSFLLNDGTHYLPDFRVGRLWLWVEARGYVTEKGQRQIREFRRHLGTKESYLAITSTGTSLTEPALSPEGMDHETHGQVAVAICGDCGLGFFYPDHEGWACRSCGSDYVFQEGRLEIDGGHLCVDGLRVRDAIHYFDRKTAA